MEHYLEDAINNTMRELDGALYGVEVLESLIKTIDEEGLSVSLLTFMDNQGLSTLLPSETTLCFKELSDENALVMQNSIKESIVNAAAKIWDFIISIATKIAEYFNAFIKKISGTGKNVVKEFKTIVTNPSISNAEFGSLKCKALAFDRVKMILNTVSELSTTRSIIIARKPYEELFDTKPNLNDPIIIAMQKVLNKMDYNINPEMAITNMGPNVLGEKTLTELGYDFKSIDYLIAIIEKLDMSKLLVMQINEKKWIAAAKLAANKEIDADVAERAKNVKEWQKFYNGFYKTILDATDDCLESLLLLSAVVKTYKNREKENS